MKKYTCDFCKHSFYAEHENVYCPECGLWCGKENPNHESIFPTDSKQTLSSTHPSAPYSSPTNPPINPNNQPYAPYSSTGSPNSFPPQPNGYQNYQTPPSPLMIEESIRKQQKTNKIIVTIFVSIVVVMLLLFIIILTVFKPKQAPIEIDENSYNRSSSAINASRHPQNNIREAKITLDTLTAEHNKYITQFENGHFEDPNELILFWLSNGETDPNLYRHAADTARQKEDYELAALLAITSYQFSGDQKDLDFADKIYPVSENFADSFSAIEALENIYEKPIEKITWKDLGKIKYVYQGFSYVNIAFDEDSTSYGIEDINSLEGFWGVENLTVWSQGAEDRYTFYYQNLKHLDIEINDDKNYTDLNPFTGYRKLEELIITSTPINSIRGLEKMPKLKELTLEDTPITTIFIPENSKLTGIHLLNNHNITNLDFLKNMKQLDSFSYSGHEVTNFMELYQHPNLKFLYLYDTKIKDISFLEKSDTLDYLYLIQNNDLISLSPIKKHKKITTLAVDGKTDGLEVIENLTNLENLTIYRPSTLAFLPKLKKLDYLILKDLSLVDDLSPIGAVKSLTALSIDSDFNDAPVTTSSNTPLTHTYYQSMDFLGELINLTRLDLENGTYFGDCSGIQKLKKLEFLSLSNSTLNLPNNINFAEYSNLDFLSIDHIQIIYNVQIETYGPITDVYYDTFESDDFIPTIGGCTNLQVLFAEEAEIKDIAFLTNCKKLKSVFIANNNITDASPLLELPNLEYVDLIDNPLHDRETLEKGEFNYYFK